MKLIDKSLVSDFLRAEHAVHHERGILGYVDIAQLLLELNTIVRNIAGGPITENFHTRERSLYEPLKAILERNLPANELVSIENALYKSRKMSSSQCDLSVHAIWHKGFDRKNRELTCSHFIEIKSVFAGESLLVGDVEHDLRKLVECEGAYGANGFFVLIGLTGELERSTVARELTKHETGSSFAYRLSSGETFYLRPAGRYVATEPFVYVFEVSAKRTKFGGNHRSGASYSIFQRK